ncbi:hypothetical protein DUNSADRAFT_9618 [Dunaliella salina]|uniref:Hemerythrin-like domain-containing protein n=1 Tax=Dunaliella salina TaxID=3046 RepID=A0ABQ7H5C1_DUNSA|nr:hypothetical protein DUNSADRAFT_9618 [Dunaliella salina]|eukprot:KAF5842049.1 hypothetical protein DUNSADRAFT_9618 [Dunaliella salina]
MAEEQPREIDQIDIISLVKQEHDVARTLLEEFKDASKDIPTQQQLCWEIIRVMSQHAAKEEEVLYPALEKIIGESRVQTCLQEHLEVKHMLKDLDEMRLDQSNLEKGRALAVKSVESTITGAYCTFLKLQTFLAHAAHEEAQELPRLTELDEKVQQDLSTKWQEVTLRAPTRPHPEAPQKPPQAVEAHKALAPADAAAGAQQLHRKRWPIQSRYDIMFMMKRDALSDVPHDV